MNTSVAMPKMLKSKDPDDPLYIRWLPDSCPYALEMRLDLIALLKSYFQTAEQLGVESGGVLIGAFPTAASPTLRIEEVVFLPGDPAALPAYRLGSEQLGRLNEILAQARLSDRHIVGFFRSQLRDTPLTPTEADFAMLSRHFKEGLYALLLLDSKSPRQGAFYLAVNGHLGETPSTPVFTLEESAFRSLPELPAGAVTGHRNHGVGPIDGNRSRPWLAVASLVILVFLIAFWTLGPRLTEIIRPPSDRINLKVISNGSNLKITWDHSAPVVSKALSATIVIVDGSARRELRLDTDDLHLGQVAYERATGKVGVSMRLETPGIALPPQTFDWSGD